MTLNIINFNLQNKYQNKYYDGGNIPKQLSNYFIKITPDIICAQELTDNYQQKLQPYLPNYNFYGQNRFSKTNLLYKHFGEKTAIITNQQVLQNKTYSLSSNIHKIGKRSFLSLLPRIATIITIQKENKKYTIINTHLDHLTNLAKKIQLKYLKKIINQNNQYPIILTGDFNLNTEDPLFQNFVKYMKHYNCKLVPIKEDTFKSTKNNHYHTPDHIFIPKNFTIQKINIQNNSFSDHKLINIQIKSS